MQKKLKKLINAKKARICVVGLGYVGLPIAVEFAKRGFSVYGFDTKAERVKKLKDDSSYISDISSAAIKSLIRKKRLIPTTGQAVLKDSDVVIICVPTPLRNKRTPDISYIIKVTKAIAKYLHAGQLIVLESTTYPGTTREVMLPILEKRGLKEGNDFFLSFSPERIDPGNKRYKFSNIPKVVGGISREAGELTKRLYSKVVNKVVYVNGAESAEVVKLLENTFRIVNIGLINEFAMLCEKLGIDVWEVIEAAETKPFGFMPFYPGPGVGGHCISIDPLYLSWKARRVGFVTKMIDLASKTNLGMPQYIFSKIEALLARRGKKISKARILVLGVTYKKDVKDLRESPAIDLIELLKRSGIDTAYSDPHVPYLKINSIDMRSVECTPKNIRRFDIAVLTTGHKRFNYKQIAQHARLILDTRNAFASAGTKAEHIIKL
jgi:UDP-N-acetyl-D-glucosamine dehydrogenase